MIAFWNNKKSQAVYQNETEPLIKYYEKKGNMDAIVDTLFALYSIKNEYTGCTINLDNGDDIAYKFEQPYYLRVAFPKKTEDGDPTKKNKLRDGNDFYQEKEALSAEQFVLNSELKDCVKDTSILKTNNGFTELYRLTVVLDLDKVGEDYKK